MTEILEIIRKYKQSWSFETENIHYVYVYELTKNKYPKNTNICFINQKNLIFSFLNVIKILKRL